MGAGKTSLVRHLISAATGYRLAIIVNEFGELGIDRELAARLRRTRTCTDDDIVELANGCLCCTVADDFLPTLTRLIERPAPPDHILIETSGLALPKPLVQAFAWPEIRTATTVDGVLTVIDAAALAAGRFADDPAAVAAQRAADPSVDHDNPLEEVFGDQLRLRRSGDPQQDRPCRAGRADATHAEIAAARLRPGVRIVESRDGRVAPGVALGLDAAAEDDLAARPSVHELDGEHDHDDFDSFVVTLNPTAYSDAAVPRPPRRRDPRAQHPPARRRFCRGARPRPPADRPGGRRSGATVASIAARGSRTRRARRGSW